MKFLFFVGVAATVVLGVLYLAFYNLAGLAFMARTPLVAVVSNSEVVTEDAIKIIFVGDIMLSRGVASQIKKQNDFRYPFLAIADTVRAADLAFGNLEGPISDGGRDQGSIYSFRAHPTVLQGLTFAGFDVLSVANNHMWDWGDEALLDTVKILGSHGITPVGAGEDELSANSPVVRQVGGTKVAFFAYTTLYPPRLEASSSTPGVSRFDEDVVATTIGAAKQFADIVVVSLHWGEEYESNANAYQKRVARMLVDAGADIVVGHHPHVIQEVEEYKNGLIFYSLGNFVFDQNFSNATMEGLMMEVTVTDGGVATARQIPIKISPTFQPYIPEL